MRKVHIKFDLPYNWGAIRKYGLYFDRLPKHQIMTGQNRTFEVDIDEQGRRMIFDIWVNCSAGVNDIPIDISNLNKGIYTVMLRNKYNVYTSKLVVL